MIEARKEPTKIEREAVEWFTRLLNPPVENEELAAFEAWRTKPENLAAYNRVEDISRLALSLQDDPDIQAVVSAARRRRASATPAVPNQRPSSYRWAIGFAVTSLLAASAVIWKISQPSYETPIGRQLTTQLPDGTRVQLNTNTALKVRFDGKVRRVELQRGQAFFDVAHDAAHPFIVAAGDTEVRAIGTRFDVRRDQGAVKVVLAEGRIAVTERGAGRPGWTLTPGEAVTTGKGVSPPRPVRTDVAAATGWTEGRIRFHATPLSDAVSEINRYSREKIVLGDDVPSDALVNGEFPIGKPAEFISGVTTLYGLKSVRRFDGATELRGPAAQL